jgi:hypothetical protein
MLRPPAPAIAQSSSRSPSMRRPMLGLPGAQVAISPSRQAPGLEEPAHAVRAGGLQPGWQKSRASFRKAAAIDRELSACTGKLPGSRSRRVSDRRVRFCPKAWPLEAPLSSAASRARRPPS